MNKKIRTIMVMMLACSCITAKAQFSNLQPADGVRMESGKSVKYDYYPGHTKLLDAESITATLFIANIKEVYATDLKAIKKGEVWTVDFILPDSALAVAIRFGSLDITDDNSGNGYVYPIYKKGQPLAGSYAARGSILIQCKRSLALGSDYAQKALALYQEEFRRNPWLKAEKELELYTALARAQKATGYPVIERKADSLLRAGFSEKNWQLAADLLQLTGKNDKVDSVKNEIAKRSGIKQRNASKYWTQVLSRREPDSMLVFLNSLKENELEEKDRASMQNMVIGEFARQGKVEQALKYLPLIKVPQVKADVLHAIAKNFIDKQERLSEADSMLNLVVNTPRMEFTDRSLTSPADWNMKYDLALSDYYHTYGLLKLKLGKMDEALSLLQSAVQFSRGRNSKINEDYLGVLQSTGRKSELIRYAAAWIADGGGSPGIMNELQKAYGEGGRFGSYLDSLQQVANGKMQRQLQFIMLEKEMPPFRLMKLDSSGNISSEDLKGKVVILDFWATWCEPCKRSFPAMQEAVHKFKKDTNVVFLFVDTWESLAPTARVSQIRKFIEKNGYDFQVMLDEPTNLQKRTYKLATALGLEGIPTKIILDRKGKIRFLSVGAQNDATRLVTELSNMIEIAMKQ